MDRNDPKPPPEYHRLQELYDRWAQVVEWYDQEMSATHRYRTFVCYQSMIVQNLDMKCMAVAMACERMAARIAELDDALEKFNAAFDEAKSQIDTVKVIAWSMQFIPEVRAESKRRSHERFLKQLNRLKTKGDDGREADGGDEWDGNVPPADREAQAPDEGAGD